MKYIYITLFFFAIAATAQGQTFSYPKIASSAKTAAQFVPKGWKIIDVANGDLNNDRRADMAIVISYTKQVKLEKAQDGYNETVFAAPRILLIAFKNRNGNSYTLQTQSNSFIPMHDNPNMEEPFNSITVKKGVLLLNFGIFMNAGSWSTTNTTYKFRYQQNAFTLIGAEYVTIHRATQDTELRSFNFSTRKVVQTNVEGSNNIKRISTRTLKIKGLKTLKTYTQPYTWQVEPYFYL